MQLITNEWRFSLSGQLTTFIEGPIGSAKERLRHVGPSFWETHAADRGADRGFAREGGERDKTVGQTYQVQGPSLAMIDASAEKAHEKAISTKSNWGRPWNRP